MSLRNDFAAQLDRTATRRRNGDLTGCWVGGGVWATVYSAS